MLTGVGAVVAAAVSVHYLRKQIRADATLEEERRKRRVAATRSRLQLALSDATQYANDAISLLKNYLDVVVSHGSIAHLAEASKPSLPEAAILAFEAMIEATDDDPFAGLIAETVSQMQVMNSRLNALHRDAEALGELNLHSYLLNAAKIYGFCGTTFPYARRETDQPPHELDWSTVSSALRSNEVDHHDYEGLHAFVQRAGDRAAQQRGGLARDIDVPNRFSLASISG